MIDFLKQFLADNGFTDAASHYLSNAITVVIVALVSCLSFVIAKQVVLRIVYKVIAKSKSKWDDALRDNMVLMRAVMVIPAVVVHAAASLFPDYQVVIERIASSIITFIVVLTVCRLLDAVNDIYNQYEVSKIKPIKGYLQVVKIFAYIIGLIVIIGIILNRSPWPLLGGLGAASALLLLVFQNSIQGLVAGIQLSANDMVRLGDWIEMPKYGADGDVIEISLTTVKVRNWDKTITTIPSYALISESFKNWRGMQESGGRRIKRAVNIDINCIRFLTEEMIERFKKIEYITEYIEQKEKEIAAHNKKHRIDPASIANGRRLTNIGVFRAYVEQYIKHNPNIHQGMTKLIRQLAPTEKGLPIEIYVFTSDTAWGTYEAIQADIFDHILAVIPEFDLRVYQSPSGNDLIQMAGKQ